ncbi:type II toxin-antitoxin system RelE/ParE family toxin [Janthinobacterium agaricidamnosum]|uniref:Plasmid stabilisation system family protein n=1 Tax=Janthinobacterium agaricidamnosum NBRC 102515 = DSM 9628 TaxID=1349767 RepID=W0VEG8_9BURK|nr:type II toxin-antitoxin system RelE/ParE family toxin [Janthinobacterium agaricidamnosum]CDG85808.1 plasmid stabilisation system family protein [Janthinobacterium agaricidamnosum NBRC 102515 = DSM 9628]
MLPVQWHPNARAKLAAILEYIAEHNDVAASALQADIERAASRLQQHPCLYRRGRVAGTREIVVHPHYVLVYRIRPSVIEIIAVLHSRQQYP